MPRRNEEGILTIGLFDFLLKEDSLDFLTYSSLARLEYVNISSGNIKKNTLSAGYRNFFTIFAADL